MVNGMVWGPVVWIPGIPFMKGDCYFRDTLKQSQSTGTQTTN